MTRAKGAALRRIQAGSLLSAFGIGFTVPFLYVYVAEVRGLGPSAAGAVLAAFAVAALVVLPVTGRIIDRRGPLPVVVAASVVAAVGALALGYAAGPLTTAGAAALLGAGTAVIQPALATLIVRCAEPAQRTRAFALQFFLQNLGLGIGGLIGGQIVDEHRPGTFTVLFAIESVMFLVLAAIAASVRLPHVPCPAVDAMPDGSTPGGLRVLLRHRAMVLLCVLGFVLFFAVYGQFESGLSAYGVEHAGITPSALGFALAANTAAIVVAQFAVLRFVERCSRTRVMAWVGGLWAFAWVIAGVAGVGHDAVGQQLATVAFVSTYALFGLGESLLAPTVPPLVADLAPEGRVGQYNSAFALVKQLALAAGPAVGGPLGAAFPLPYVLGFVVVSLGITVLALRLGRRLTAAQDRPASLAGSQIVARHVPEQLPAAA